MPRSSQARPQGTTDASIIALDKFILATRDSGYKGTSSALCEIVDNAIQAKASKIQISITSAGTEPNQQHFVSVLDDGIGMDPFTLREAIRFGGSSRFNDREGLGRYGMGLPNSSLSQARRLTVYSWQKHDEVYATYLDVDEIACGDLAHVPTPKRSTLPLGPCPSASGTLVVWDRCDRLDNRRVSTICRKVSAVLGQVFRMFLWDGTKILINGQPLEPIDPLFLRRSDDTVVAERFGPPLDFEVRASTDADAPTGRVRVTFTELPVHKLAHLSNEQKREHGIAKGAGVSIIRGRREVDYGWFFMGNKRRENYDDWFRCQIEFDPILDEAFGITHTKQQVRPQQFLIDALTPDIEQTAHALNARARRAHAALAAAERSSLSEDIAQARDHLLRPISPKATEATRTLANALKRKHPSLRSYDEPSTAASYRIIEDDLRDTDFFSHAVIDKQFVIVLNEAHPFFKRVFRPLADSQDKRDAVLRSQLELLILAAARAASVLSGKAADEHLAKFRREWSNTLATLLNA